MCSVAYYTPRRSPFQAGFSHPDGFDMISEIDHSLGHWVSILESCVERGIGEQAPNSRAEVVRRVLLG